MENGQRPGNGQGNAEMLQQALRAFGPGSGNNSAGAPPTQAEIAAMAQRAGLTAPGTGPVPVAAEAPRGQQYVFIALDKVEMAWPTNKVAGVERAGDITPVPFTHDWVLGVANLRGVITSVVDLSRFFGLAPITITPRSRIVVASAGNMTIGFLIDNVNEIRALPPEALTPDGIRQASPPWLVPYVEAVASVVGRRALAIDLERLLFADHLHHYRSDIT